MISNFKEEVLAIVKKISAGKTMTYKEVAARAGSPHAYRAVGNILNKNYDSKIPCHRVIRSDGKIGGYNRGAEKKAKILKKEGIKVQDVSMKINDRGFTLIELLVVISIIGLLSTVAMTSTNAARTKARESKASAVLHQIEVAANIDYQNYGTWSPDIGPNQCSASCNVGATRPRYVVDGHFSAVNYDDIKWYCPTCCYDWQLWESGNWVSIDIYRLSDTCTVTIVRRKCIYDAPGGGTCVNI